MSVAAAAPTQQTLLGGNVGFADAFVDITKDIGQITQIVNGVVQWSNPTPPRQDANGNLLADFNLTCYDNLAPGTYNASFTGAPQTKISGVATGTDATGKGISQSIAVLNQVTVNGVTTVQLVVPSLSGGVNGGIASGLQLEFTNTGGTLQNLHIIRPGYSAVNPPLFTTDFLNSYAALGPTSLRFMDADDTNGNVVTNWSDRTLPTNAFPEANKVTESIANIQSLPAGAQVNPIGAQQVTSLAGLPWEYDIALANALHADMWINIPVNATDDYVRQLANLLKNGDTVGGVYYAGLAPGLHVYVEYGNELWNYGFQQTGYNLANAILAVTDAPNPVTGQVISGSNLDFDGAASNQYEWAQRLAAQRTVQIVEDFAAVYGQSAINNQVRGVLASNGGTTQENALEYINQFIGSPKNYLFGLAMNPYFTLTTAQDQNPNLTSTQILADLQADLGNLTPSIQSFVTESHAWGLSPLAYEGGPSLGDPSGGASALHLQANVAAEMSPQFASIVQQELNVWFANGGGQFNFYSLGEAEFGYGSQYGDWAITDNLDSLSEPKEAAYKAVPFQRAGSPGLRQLHGLQRAAGRVGRAFVRADVRQLPGVRSRLRPAGDRISGLCRQFQRAASGLQHPLAQGRHISIRTERGCRADIDPDHRLSERQPRRHPQVSGRYGRHGEYRGAHAELASRLQHDPHRNGGRFEFVAIFERRGNAFDKHGPLSRLVLRNRSHGNR